MKKHMYKNISKAITMALLATLIIQLWVAVPVGSNDSMQGTGKQKGFSVAGNNTATTTHASTTWDFSNTTTESTTPLEGVYIAEHIISTWEEKWEIPGTPVNETINLFFVFQLNTTTQENTSALFFGNVNVMTWFIGYEYDNSMKNATPYQSGNLTFNTEELLQNPDVSEQFTTTIIGDRCVYNYTGTIRHLFETHDKNINDTFITVTKMYYISEINHPLKTTMSNKAFNTETWDTKEKVWVTDEEGGWWWYEKDIRNYYKLNTKNIPRLIVYGNEKQTKHYLNTISEGVAHMKKVKKVLGGYKDPYTGGHVNMYGNTFQIYTLPGTTHLQVNITIRSDTSYNDANPRGNKYYFITNNETDNNFNIVRHVFEKVTDNSTIKGQTYIYNFNTSLVDWNYISVFTTLPRTHVTITADYNGVQSPGNLTDAIRTFDMLSTDKIGKLWYDTVMPGNTTITHNITKTSQSYTLWNNKTSTCSYYNNSEGSDNITYNNVTYINGTWTPSTENTSLNEDMFVVNPENINGTNPDIWFLKYTYITYKRTVVEAEKTTDCFMFTYNYTHNTVFDYTQKMKTPIEFETDTFEGKLTPCVDSNVLVYYPELLMISQNYFDNWNKNTQLGFIQPDLNETTCQGRYLKNVWTVALPNPVVYGQYIWVPQQGKTKQYHHYEITLPWSVYHNYTYTLVENRWLSVDPNLRPDEFTYDSADKSYHYTVTDDQINNDDFQHFNITLSLSVNITVYEDGSEYDCEEYLLSQKQRLDVHKITPSRIKIYLKEDIWEQQNTYQSSPYLMTYKVYTFTPQDVYGYNETGINNDNFTSESYPYLGFIFRCRDETYNNLSSSSSNMSEYANLTSGIAGDVENLTGEDIPDEVLNATPYINIPRYFNASFTIYTLDADRAYPAYQQYVFTIQPSIITAGQNQAVFDETTFEKTKDEMQDAFENQNITLDTTNITFTMIQNYLPENTRQYLQSSLITMNKTATIVKIKTQKIEETSIVGFFDITKIDDTTNISFRNKDTWTTTEINNLLDTTNWLTYVKPMKTQLQVDVDKEKPEKGENVNVTIKLLIGNNGEATIDGKYAAANQPVTITYQDQNGNIVTETRYTNSTGFILMDFTAPGEKFVFTVSYDTTKMYVGSTEFSKKIGAMSLWDFIGGLMGPMIIIGIFLIIILVTYDSVRRVIWGKNRPWRILK